MRNVGNEIHNRLRGEVIYNLMSINKYASNRSILIKQIWLQLKPPIKQNLQR